MEPIVNYVKYLNFVSAFKIIKKSQLVDSGFRSDNGPLCFSRRILVTEIGQIFTRTNVSAALIQIIKTH